jgi:pimeloyl-ACP methyl ester carboxylesterase
VKEDFSVIASDGHVVRGSVSTAEHAKGAALLVHGITSDRHEWGLFDSLCDELNLRSITSVAIDYRGHGESALSIDNLSLSGVLLDIQAGWRHLNTIARSLVDQRKVVVGNSFGGGLVFLFGALDPTVNVTIATCPVMSYVADLERVNPNWRLDSRSGWINYVNKKLPCSIIAEMWAYDSLIDLVPTPRNCAIFHGTSDSDVPYSESEDFIKKRVTVELIGLQGMDHSFSAPEGTPDRDKQSKLFRAQAAQAIADYIVRPL